jgi:Protein of unknown function (DUF2510)
MANYAPSPAGWYPDPSGAHQLRYFGTTWTDHVSNAGVVTTSPIGRPTLGTAAVGAPAPPAAWPTATPAAQPFSGMVQPPAAGVPAVGHVKSTGSVLVLIGGVLMTLGTMLPWETVSAESIYSGTLATVKGTSEGAGPLVLVAGLVVALLAVLVLTSTIGKRNGGVATLVIAAASLVFTFGNWSSISKDIKDAPTGVTATIGIGLVLAATGGMLAVIASIALVRKRR